MNKTFEITMEAGVGNRRIKAYEDGDCVLDIIIDYYNVEGASLILKALGYNRISEDY